MRKTKFANNEYYHIYNRGVDKRDVFMDEKDFTRFLKGMKEFNGVELIGSLRDKDKRDRQELDSCSYRSPTPVCLVVKIIAYCLNPNHYHFIVKQITDKGIEKFMHRIGTSYTNYFNLKYERSGALFQGRFKSIHIDTNEYLLWLSGYVNGNDRIHSVVGIQSLQDYLNLRNGALCNQDEMKIILDQFPNAKEYEKFVEMVIKESRKRKDVEKFLLEQI